MWTPDDATLAHANLTRWIKVLGLRDYRELHRWSIDNRADFWSRVISELGIRFRGPARATLDDSGGPTAANWLPGAELNIVDSCFQADDDATAIIFGGPAGDIQRLTYEELRLLSGRVANGLWALGYVPGDAVAVVLPMTAESVAVYLGIVAAGCVVVSIADSFAAPQIASRLSIASARAVFTYDTLTRRDKTIELYSRVIDSQAPRTIVLPASRGTDLSCQLRDGDIAWRDFLSDDEALAPHVAAVGDPINILFSSGTTGDPKAIPWNHTTPIKCAADGLFHHDLHADDVVAWPTNLGWMMGPWLIFASLINRGTVALFEDAPVGEAFGRFVEEVHVTMLGVVPTLVSAWRASGCMETLDWSDIRAFSSTGEASNAENMRYLSELAGSRPIIEYCGGTEIGGGYITSTVIEPNEPATFTTATMGLDFVILDEQGQAADEGELFLVPPSIGLSSELLNRDHRATYYEGVPADPTGRALRRHGDHFRRLPSGLYAAGGRVDDTMNLGGIKISSAEIEKVLNRLPNVRETAAVAVVAEQGGPDQLVIFAVLEKTDDAADNLAALLADMNKQVRAQLNPLFKIQRVIAIDEMPRTASNKVMRRKLRDQLVAQ